MKDILTKNVGTENIVIDAINAVELRPTTIILKENGAVGDTPSLCFILTHPHLGELSPKVYGQVSVKMLNEALNELGYELKPLDKPNHAE